MKKIFVILISIVLFNIVQAGNVKIAVIDADQVFKKYYKTKIVEASLMQQMQVYKAWLKKLAKSYQQLRDEYKVLLDDTQNIALSRDERERKRVAAMQKMRQIQEKKAEIAQYTKEKTAQMKQLEAKKRHDILEDIKKVIASRAALEGYSIVIDRSGVTMNGISSVLYYKDNMDITAKIIQDLNRGHSKKKR